MSRSPTDLMWVQAWDLLEQAERMQRHFFRLTGAARPYAVWEPPVDVLEDEREIVIAIALPGVPEERIEITTEAGALVVRATGGVPLAGSRSVRQLEIPYGHFERRIALPDVPLAPGTRESRDGLLILTLRKIGYAGQR